MYYFSPYDGLSILGVAWSVCRASVWAFFEVIEAWSRKSMYMAASWEWKLSSIATHIFYRAGPSMPIYWSWRLLCWGESGTCFLKDVLPKRDVCDFHFFTREGTRNLYFRLPLAILNQRRKAYLRYSLPSWDTNTGMSYSSRPSLTFPFKSSGQHAMSVRAKVSPSIFFKSSNSTSRPWLCWLLNRYHRWP